MSASVPRSSARAVSAYPSRRNTVPYSVGDSRFLIQPFKFSKLSRRPSQLPCSLNAGRRVYRICGKRVHSRGRFFGNVALEAVMAWMVCGCPRMVYRICGKMVHSRGRGWDVGRYAEASLFDVDGRSCGRSVGCGRGTAECLFGGSFDGYILKDSAAVAERHREGVRG